ncbi:DUF2169 domain-containing protein [Escherichia whittamii]|uniref:DUF2169 domain-containing protein n=1 Tax=Escherichia whittamii TaxID=2762229 RepID=A0ABR8TJQ2_9ESCH|nr:DUF2169 domain-containing protein [Escherichia whittamii]MBD7975539.1 DUF2169 domain-containing protein [Escherichia whittamii]MCA4890832.1 DUF2169 domain-containing protein [Escherichia whittamii]MEB7939623.1 DUF2169 domain-containing protein [Escherichia whittamii]
MEIINGAKHTVADATTLTDKAGRQHLVVIIKATYRIPANGRTPRPQIPPQPLSTEDKFTGEPGISAPLYEVDFIRHKGKCDVLFNARAYAPQGKPVTELDTIVEVGKMKKMLRVTGNRQWDRNTPNTITKPEPFTVMPLNYDHAFGGVQHYKEGNEILPDVFEKNPTGKGYLSKKGQDISLALPNLEVINKPLIAPQENYEPVALSAIARNWLPRRLYAGTYDQRWKEEFFPLLPDDFDERYYQCAPEDQQIDYPVGGEDVILRNMMQGREEVRFKLPRLNNLPVKILMSDYQVHTLSVVADTIYFEPDESRFSVVWRASLPIKRRIQKIQTVAVGHVCSSWWNARVAGSLGCTGCSGQKEDTTAQIHSSDDGEKI